MSEIYIILRRNEKGHHHHVREGLGAFPVP